MEKPPISANGPLFSKFTSGRRHQFAKKVAGCAECGKTSLYRVGAKGYCKEHIEAAKRHMKAIRHVYDSEEKAGRLAQLSSAIDDETES